MREEDGGLSKRCFGGYIVKAFAEEDNMVLREGTSDVLRTSRSPSLLPHNVEDDAPFRYNARGVRKLRRIPGLHIKRAKNTTSNRRLMGHARRSPGLEAPH